ncbi:hypothetical protein U472_14885 [Orenia metallireducens]|jgi:hypothetical protein|uniref:DUF1009 domain-containing protein n=1 Tax=Orenia metallireducens TaxID=1413210 RepID=A0A1C0A636_9FIRM|nr:UDP-2,3-diacylglucosamine diphosphatase LpxI [Orenia metallireducens]OCL25612.1 hypothetical protein U472_14885 [Orenia metallireducens]
MARIGLLAGNGNLPVEFTYAAKAEGNEVVAIALTPEAEVDKLKSVATKLYQISAGQLNKIINTLKEEGISEVVMLGKVTKELLYQGIELDQRFMLLLSNLKEKNDDSIMLAIVKELESAGIKISNQTKYIAALLPAEGLLTEVEPDAETLADMKYGFKMAKEIGGLDIGQTVVVKDKAVMAVEAIEGTDQAILRGGQLGRGGVIVAKVSKPQQDFRFDIPAVGLDTLDKLVKVKAKGLIIEAKKTFIVNQEEFIKGANEAGIAVVAMEED